MRVFLNNDDGRYVGEYLFNRYQRRNIIDFLNYQKERQEKTPENHLLFFGGGQWSVPNDKFNEMYKELIKAYGRILNE